MFAFGPTIKFKLAWKDKAITPFQTRSAALIQRLSKQNRAKKAQDPLQQSPKEQPQQQTSNSLRVFYQFIYNNNTRQQTEARDDFFCPWCSLDCVKLYNLLKHLKTCHSRFIFMYTVCCFMEWLNYWLTDWSINWLAPWLIWLSDSLIDYFFYHSRFICMYTICCFKEWLNDWLIDWSVDWMIDWLTPWLINWLIEWLIDKLIYWLHDWLIDWLIDWVSEWVSEWLIDWLTMNWLLIDWLYDFVEYLE